MGQGNVYFSCNYSSTISFLVKILLVKIKCLYIQYAWIMKKQHSNQDGKVEKMVILVKTFNHDHWKWNLDRNLITTLLIILTWLMSKIMRSLRSSKCLKTTVELTLTTEKANACSRWTACSVFNWKYFYWVNLVWKLKNISLSWNFVPRLIQICRIPWRCSLFLFLIGNIFLSKSCPKNQNYQFELKFCTRLIWICSIR